MGTRTRSELHAHTDRSNLKLIDCINTPEMLIDRGKEIGLNAIAITDHDCLSAHIKALNYFEEKYGDDPTYKLILGNEIYLTREGVNEHDHQKGERFNHLILLAKDAIGHHQLRQISTRAWGRAYTRAILRTPTYMSDLHDIIGKNPGHVICGTACLGNYAGWLHTTKPIGWEAYIDSYLTELAAIFGDDFYIELQPSDNSEQVEYNKYMVRTYWGKYMFTVTTDAHYLTKEERGLHRDTLQSKDAKGNREVDGFYDTTYLMDAEEVASYFVTYLKPDKIDALLTNSNIIADRVGRYSLKRLQEVPKIPKKIDFYKLIPYDRFKSLIPEGQFPALSYYFSDEACEADMYLACLIADGYLSSVANAYVELYFQRLEQELDTFKQVSESERVGQPLSDYFITMAKIIEVIWTEGDSIVGPGRGSAGGSLIVYLCGITTVDPLRQELDMPFFRFMHPSRPELPDIDIDTESSKRVRIYNALKRYFVSIGSDILNICTIGTLGTKSAIRVAAKGLGIDPTIAGYIAGMVPNERGSDWTLDQCMVGDEEHPRIGQFGAQMRSYPQLWTLAKRIEGLAMQLGVHASGVAILSGDITNYTSMMKTSKGVEVTCWDLGDSEQTGVLKYDLLTVQGIDKIRTCLNLLLEDKQIEWEGDLRRTYMRHLDPQRTLDHSSPGLWKMIQDGHITDLFQYDTMVGSRAIKMIQPKNVAELAIGNNLMRLMTDEKDQPLDVFIRNKNDIQAWYNEMERWGLTADEVKVLEPHLLDVYGIAASQESVMKLSMDPAIANFDVKEANILRKGIARKKPKVIEATRQLFYSKGRAIGTSENLLNYIWKHQIGMSLGYSFSDLHSVSYSLIALQQAHLAFHFPPLYWYTACLSVNASAVNEEDYENLIDEEILEVMDEEDKNVKSKIDYAKIVSAIDSFKDTISIDSPDINRSRYGFVPSLETNSIVYGLRGIAKVGEGVIDNIMRQRPFSSLSDFVDRMREDGRTLISKDKVVNLIKAGAFDKLQNQPREQIMEEYLGSLTPRKKNLTISNLPMLMNNGLMPNEGGLKRVKGVYLFTKMARANRNADKTLYILGDQDSSMYRWYTAHVGTPLFDGTSYYISSSMWDSRYKEEMDVARAWLKENKEQLIDDLHRAEIQSIVDKYAKGTILDWELDAINFYKSGHPLTDVVIPGITTTPLNEIVDSHIEGYFTIKGNEIPRYKIYTILGTVLVRDKSKHLITFSTPEGVVKVNIYKQSFAKYDKDIEDKDGNLVQSSFLSKGNVLLLSGILRDGIFVPKVYKSTKMEPIARVVFGEDGEALVELKK